MVYIHLMTIIVLMECFIPPLLELHVLIIIINDIIIILGHSNAVC